MAALIAARLTAQREPRARRLPVAAAIAVWQGGMVALQGLLAVPAATATNIRVLGVAADNADNRLGLAGALSVDIVTGCFRMDNDAVDPITTADLGNPCFATDDHTVARTNGAVGNGPATKVAAGTIFDVDDVGVWVKF